MIGWEMWLGEQKTYQACKRPWFNQKQNGVGLGGVGKEQNNVLNVNERSERLFSRKTHTAIPSTHTGELT